MPTFNTAMDSLEKSRQQQADEKIQLLQKVCDLNDEIQSLTSKLYSWQSMQQEWQEKVVEWRAWASKYIPDEELEKCNNDKELITELEKRLGIRWQRKQIARRNQIRNQG